MSTNTSDKIVIPGQYITPEYKVDESTNQTEKYLSGKGTIVSEIEVDGSNKKFTVISSTIVGRVIIKDVDSKEYEFKSENEKSIKHFIVTVVPKSNSYIDFQQEINNEISLSKISINLPQENDVVLVRITKINQRQAYCEILSVEGYGNVIKDDGIGSNGELAHLSVPSGGGSQSLSTQQTIASSQSTSINAIASDLGETFKGIIRSQDVRSTDRDKVKIIDCFRPGDIVRAVIISLGDGSYYYLSTSRNDLGVVFAKSEGGAGDLMFPVDWQTMIDRRTGLIENRKCAKPFN